MKKVSFIALQHPEHKQLWLHGLRRDNGKYACPGGHANSGETPAETAAREMNEEIGLSMKPEELQECRNGCFNNEHGKIQVTMFIAKCPKDFVFNRSDDPDGEFSQLSWINPLVHPEIHVPPERNLLIHHLRGIEPVDKLDKAEPPPTYIGQKHSWKPYVAQKHPVLKFAWHYHPSKQAEMDRIVKEKAPSFINRLPEQHRDLASKFISHVSSLPTRHTVLSWDQNPARPVPRQRHMHALVSGDPNAVLTSPEPGILHFTLNERHGTITTGNTWRFDGKTIQPVAHKQARQGLGHAPEVQRKRNPDSFLKHVGKRSVGDEQEGVLPVRTDVRNGLNLQDRSGSERPPVLSLGKKILKKGAPQRLWPFKPKDVPKDDIETSHDWTSGNAYGNPHSLKLKLSPEAKARALHKLHKETQVRRHPKTGEREFLLHRGTNKGHADSRIKDGFYHGSQQLDPRSSWTSDWYKANAFSIDNKTREHGPHVISAWVPESAIAHIPNQWGEKASEYPTEKEVNVTHDKPFEVHPDYDVMKDPTQDTTGDIYDKPFDTSKRLRHKLSLKDVLPKTPFRYNPGFDKKELIPGGKASGRKPSEFDREQLKEGVKVEMEHTDDPRKAIEIAMDHLVEDPKYYIKLKQVHLDKKDLDPSLGYQIDHIKPDMHADTKDWHPSKHSFNVVAKDKNGKWIGQTHVVNMGGDLTPGYTHVDAEHRRKGVASAMYQYAERVSGRTLRPSNERSRDAKNLWGQPKRQFGHINTGKEGPGQWAPARDYWKQKLNKAELVKGAPQRIAPFKHPVVDPHEEYMDGFPEVAAVHGWTNAESDAEGRDSVPPIEGAAKIRAFRKLASVAQSRINPKTKMREYLLFRGHSPEEDLSTHEKTGQTTSWTPHDQVAVDFARWVPQGQIGHVTSAWIPEHTIMAVPNYQMLGPNRHRAEHEVIVHPHQFQVHQTGQWYGFTDKKPIQDVHGSIKQNAAQGSLSGTRERFGKPAAYPPTQKIYKSSLSKGADGDWKKEGYTLKIHPPVEARTNNISSHKGKNVLDWIEHTVTAHDPTGKMVGKYTFQHFNTDYDSNKMDNKLIVGNAHTGKGHRRKGLASGAYALAERHVGVPISNEPDSRTPLADALWSQPKRSFGKKEIPEHKPLITHDEAQKHFSRYGMGQTSLAGMGSENQALPKHTHSGLPHGAYELKDIDPSMVYRGASGSQHSSEPFEEHDEKWARNYASQPEETMPAIIIKPHPLKSGYFQVLDGATRLRAAHIARRPSIKAYVHSTALTKSKNVREQKKKLFGGWKTQPESKQREKQMQQMKEFIEPRYNMPVKRAKGKPNVQGKIIDKPDLTTEQLQHIGNPDSLIHEVAHLEVAPEKTPVKDFQHQMDELWGKQNVRYGFKQQSRLAPEYEATAIENKLRRRLGLPAHGKTRKLTRPDEQQFAADRPDLKIVRDYPNKPVKTKSKTGEAAVGAERLAGGSEVLSPETRQLMIIRESSKAKYHPKRGWSSKPTADTFIRLREEGFGDTAKVLAREYFLKLKPKVARDLGEKVWALEQVKKSESLIKAPEQAFSTNEQEDSWISENLPRSTYKPSESKVKTAMVGRVHNQPLFHHVIENGSEIQHMLSHHKNPSKDGLVHLIGETYKGALQVLSSAANPHYRSMGLGTKLYDLAAKHHGALSSDYALSEASDAIYRKLAKKPGYKAKLRDWGTAQGHFLQYKKQKSIKKTEGHQHVSNILSGKYGFISAHQAGKTPAENDKATESLRGELQALGLNFTPVRGRWGGSEENSFMVHGVDRHVLSDMGRRYGQQAVIHGENGNHEEIATHPDYKGGMKGRGWSQLGHTDDNYSEIDTPSGKFRFGLHFNLNKGQAGDWQREGYFLRHSVGKNNFRVTAHDPDGNEVGSASISSGMRQGNNPIAVPYKPVVHPEHRRKGLGTAMYQRLEQISGHRLVPDVGRTEAAKGLWRNPKRKFGRWGKNALWRLKKSQSVRLEHYSPFTGIKEIDPVHHGKTTRGAEIKRGPLEHPLSFFYEAGSKPEDMVAGNARAKYTVELDPARHKIYELDQDPDGLVRQAIQRNNGAWNMDMVSRALKDAGYHGFRNRSSALPHAVALFHKHPVSKEDPYKHRS